MIQPASREEESPPAEIECDTPDRSAFVREAIRRSHSFFLRAQQPEGYWVTTLEADTTLESDYVFLLRLLAIDDEIKIQKATRHVRGKQLPGGGWNIYHGGPEEINATVKAYTALKLSGAPIDDPVLVGARAAIHRMGGMSRVNTYTRTYLHLIEQFPEQGTPAIPPEVILFPRWVYFNIYQISSWSRTILVPLSVVYALQPHRRIPEKWGIQELYPEGMDKVEVRLQRSEEILSWRNFFLLLNDFLKVYEKSPVKIFRTRALKRAEEWILSRLEKSAGLGAIYPAIVNAVIALKALGYPTDHFQIRRALGELEKLIMERDDSLQFQPCESPVWDTGLTMLALLKSGMPPDHPALVQGAEWLLEKQTRDPGDWKVKNPDTPAGGWYFQHFNEFYPDTDDTCVALMVLRLVQHPDSERNSEAQKRGLRWLLDMQSRNGGWGSFDRDNDRELFTKFPFADHNAMIDPPSVDITGRILEMLGHFGYTHTSPIVAAAIKYLRREQEPDGSWFGRWGVNYIYGTWQVLKGLSCIGEDMSQEYVLRAADWLRNHQMPDGGWGETCRSYDDPSTRGEGPSTPSQTAWAVMGLLAAGDRSSSSLLRGIDYLLERQKPSGDWDEQEFTGTGFPSVFYLRYCHYCNYFPLFALGMCRELLDSTESKGVN